MEEKLKSKLLYKLQLYILKVIPMVMAFCYLLNIVLGFFDVDLEVLSYISSCSIFTLVFLYLSSYVFKFCEYHRVFLHYITVNWLLNIYDLYIGIPLSDRDLLSLYLIISCIFLFVILYFHVKDNKKSVSQNYI